MDPHARAICDGINNMLSFAIVYYRDPPRTSHRYDRESWVEICESNASRRCYVFPVSTIKSDTTHERGDFYCDAQFFSVNFFCLFLIPPSSTYTAHFFSVLHGFGVNLTPFGIRKRIFIFPRFFFAVFFHESQRSEWVCERSGGELVEWELSEKSSSIE